MTNFFQNQNLDEKRFSVYSEKTFFEEESFCDTQPTVSASNDNFKNQKEVRKKIWRKFKVL